MPGRRGPLGRKPGKVVKVEELDPLFGRVRKSFPLVKDRQAFDGLVDVYNSFVGKRKPVYFSFDEFLRVMHEGQDPDKTLSEISRETKLTTKNVRRILVTTNLRDPKKLKDIANRAWSRETKLLLQKELHLEDAIVDRLRDLTKTMRQIAKEVGVGDPIVVEVNKKHKIRGEEARSLGLKLAHARKDAPLKSRIRELARAKTVEGEYKYSAKEIVGLTDASPSVVRRIYEEERPLDKRKRSRYAGVTSRSRRGTFVRRALKSTITPTRFIAERLCQRQKRFGGKATKESIYAELRRDASKLKKEHELPRTRFMESKAAEDRARKAFWKSPKPLKKVDFDQTAGNLKVPIYFVRKVFTEQVINWATDMFVKDTYDLYAIQKKTGLPLHQLEVIQQRVWRLKGTR